MSVSILFPLKDLRIGDPTISKSPVSGNGSRSDVAASQFVVVAGRIDRWWWWWEWCGAHDGGSVAGTVAPKTTAATAPIAFARVECDRCEWNDTDEGGAHLESVRGLVHANVRGSSVRTGV